MKSSLSGLRLIVLGAAAFALAACGSTSDDASTSATTASSSTAAQPAPAPGAPVPGSEQDFVVNVGDRVFFETDSSALSAPARTTLQRQAAWLEQYPDVAVTVEGHADERGTREYNLALGARRANSAKDYLVSLGVNPARVSTISYGKERPVALCSDESCWSQNRRAVTVLGPRAGV